MTTDVWARNPGCKEVPRGRLLFLEIFAGATIGLMKAADHWYEFEWWVGISSALLVIVALYLNRCQAEHERREKDVAVGIARAAEAQAILAHEQAKQRELKRLRTYTTTMAGNLAHLLQGLIEGRCEVEALRVGLLSNAVDVAISYLGLERGDDRITATWCVPRDEFKLWEVVAYDRRQADRQPGHKREIKEGIPGAAEAFLTGNRIFIPDTQDTTVSKWFVERPYRSILSVPARTMNMAREHNVTINGERNFIVGVLNVDCSVCGVLTEELGGVLQESAYVMGLLERIGGRHVGT